MKTGTGSTSFASGRTVVAQPAARKQRQARGVMDEVLLIGSAFLRSSAVSGSRTPGTFYHAGTSRQIRRKGRPGNVGCGRARHPRIGRADIPVIGKARDASVAVKCG